MPRRQRKPTRPRRVLLGYWHAGADRFSHPQGLADATWEAVRRPLIVRYLTEGGLVAVACGHSYCRFGCEQQYETEYVDEDGRVRHRTETHSLGNGSAMFADDTWCWPQGLAHYVEHHHVRLPSEFVTHLAAREFEPFGDTDVGFVECDQEFWVGWCARNAPFEYEARCHACQAQRR